MDSAKNLGQRLAGILCWKGSEVVPKMRHAWGDWIQVCLQTSHLFHATDLVGYYDHCICDLSHLVHQFRLVLQTPLKCSCAVKEKQYHTTENCITLQTCEMRPP